MAENFQILVRRNSENLHLKLMGDFDGISAYELIDTLKKPVITSQGYLPIPTA
jgi:hypothetical protein